MWNITYGYGSVPKYNKQPFKFPMWTYIWSRQNVNMNNFNNSMRPQCIGHGSVPENNEQPFKFIASNSAEKPQFCKRCWNRQCRNGQNGDDFANFCPLCHGGSSERLLKCAIGAELETANLKCCPIFMITLPWPLRELLWYVTSLQTNILTFITD